MLSSKILASVTKRKSFMNNPTLLSTLMHDTHMSTGVDAVESRVNDLADGKCRYAGKLSLFKSQMLVYVWHQPHVVGTLSPHKYMSNCYYSTHYADSSTINSQHKLLGNIPRYVKIVEVGPRDGLQNEKDIVPTAVKVELIKMLVDSGLEVVEATSFVSPKWVPQLADAKDVIEATKRIGGARFPVLTPNLKGLEAALAAGVKEVAVFAAASESFSRSNINCSIDESLSRYRDVASAAEKHSIPVRGYISCVVGCPMEGAVHPSKVAYVAEELVKMGCAEISLGDTIGVGTPGTVIPMIEAVKNVVPIEKLAVHFHDTYGQALSNILISLQTGPARQLMVRPLSQTCQLREKKQLFIDELEVGVSGTIVVMLCRKWDVNAKTGRYLSTDFIVSDGKGNIMHCTSNATVSHNFVGKLHNGMIYSIKDFTVIQNKEEYRVIKDAQYMIEFDWSTTVRKAVIKADGFVRHPFQLVPFESIEPTDNKFMIDVVGYITNVGRLTYQKTGSRNLDFYLANQSGQSIR